MRVLYEIVRCVRSFDQFKRPSAATRLMVVCGWLRGRPGLVLVLGAAGWLNGREE